MSDVTESTEVGGLIPDPQVRRDISISAMAMWRWDHDPRMAELGWPPPIYIGPRKFRDAKQYQRFKANLLRQAIAKRAALLHRIEHDRHEKEVA